VDKGRAQVAIPAKQSKDFQGRVLSAPGACPRLPGACVNDV
jgi:hypothetical protein